VTVATFEVDVPSNTEKVNESGPVYPLSGVYWIVAVSVFGAPGEHEASATVPSTPCVALDSIVNIRSHVSGSVPERGTATGVSFAVAAEPSFAEGGSFDPVTVIDTVAGVEPAVPSWTRKVNESEPSKFGAGVYVTVPTSVFGSPGVHGAFAMEPRDPVVGFDTIENVNSQDSTSLPDNWIDTGVSSVVEALAPVAFGGVFGGGGGPLGRNSLW
jgi:hypothetical protein